MSVYYIVYPAGYICTPHSPSEQGGARARQASIVYMYVCVYVCVYVCLYLRVQEEQAIMLFIRMIHKYYTKIIRITSNEQASWLLLRPAFYHLSSSLMKQEFN